MSVTILHLSDIHIKSSGDAILSKHVDIAACTYSSLPEASHVFIVVSGEALAKVIKPVELSL